jgi:8-oxo-dGTP pyrophosphatase MutT (NUDIX family)
MVAFDKEKVRFNYRVAGVAIHNERILLDRNTRNSYWVLPGGHPDMMEPMAIALRREVKEEIGADVEVIRLLWVLENFFHKSKRIHELSFYFLMQLHPESRLLKGDGPFYGDEQGHPLIFQWFPLDEIVLQELPLFPGNLPRALINLPETTQHIVFNDLPDLIQESKIDTTLKTDGQKKAPANRLTIS